LAERWETPDPVTYVFHMHPGVKFHDGRPLTSRDVKWTFDSLLSGKIRQHQSIDLPLGRPYRCSGRRHGDLSFEGAFRRSVVEFIGGSDRHRALWERRRDVAGPGGKWTFSFYQRGGGQGSGPGAK